MLSYNDFKTTYDSKNEACEESLGKLYNWKENHLFDTRCNMWNCPVCRPVKKMQLYVAIVQNVLIFDLYNHLVITSEGKRFREENSWIESYYYMNDKWRKLSLAIERKFGSFSYIVLPRAQSDGYCHYHMFINIYIPWKWMDGKRKKYGLGYSSIKKNKDTAEYLNKDFFKNPEWIIPKNVRHYRSSRNILLNNYGLNNDVSFVTSETSDENIKKLFPRVDLDMYYVERELKKEYRRLLKAILKNPSVKDYKTAKLIAMQCCNMDGRLIVERAKNEM